MIYTAHNSIDVKIATAEGLSNAARLFVGCPDIYALKSNDETCLELDALYLMQQGVSRTYDNVYALLADDPGAAKFWAAQFAR